MGCEMLFNYGMKTNIPRNVHDLSRARLSYSAIATNIRRMMPKSLIDGCIGFADMLQITHLKLQQAIAKAKPDGLIIDIEGLENVQLGKGGDLQYLSSTTSTSRLVSSTTKQEPRGRIPEPTCSYHRQPHQKHQRAGFSVQPLSPYDP